LVGRDHPREDILVRPALAAAVVLGLALLDADLADEGLALEILVVDCARGVCLRAHVIGLEPERAIEDRLEPAVADIDSLGMPVGGAFDDKVFPELTVFIEAINDGELAVEHLAAAVLAALEQATLAGAAGAKMGAERRDRAVRDKLDIPRRRSRRVVKGWHGFASSCLGGLLG